MKRSYFNDLAPRWDGLPSPPESAAGVRRFVGRSGAAEARSILDTGCGTGVLLPAILEIAADAAGIVETDFAERMLLENAAKFADRRIRRVCADAVRLPFTGEKFDLVLCFGILPHLEDQRAALAEFLRVLVPGGALCVGHLMSSSELNAFHGSLGGPVAGDVLPAADALSDTLERLGAPAMDVEETPGWYFVLAKKARRC